MIYDTRNIFFLFFRRRFNLIEPKEMEVLVDLEQALHLSDDVSTSTGSVASNNNSSSSCNSSCNLNSNTVTVTQAIISSSPLRSIGGSTTINTPLDGGLNVHNSQIDDSTVIVKQPLISDSATSMLNNNNDLATKDRVLVSAAVDTQPI